MVFEVGSAINGAAEWFCNASFVNRIASNTIFAGLLITAIAAVIMLAIYQWTSVREGGHKRALKACVYLLVAVSAVMFIHHYALERSLRREISDQRQRSVFGAIQGGRIGPSNYGVHEIRAHDTRTGGGYREETRAFSQNPDMIKQTWEGIGQPMPHSYDYRGGAQHASSTQRTGGAHHASSAQHANGVPNTAPNPNAGPITSQLPITDVVVPALHT